MKIVDVQFLSFPRWSLGNWNTSQSQNEISFWYLGKTVYLAYTLIIILIVSFVVFPSMYLFHCIIRNSYFSQFREFRITPRIKNTPRVDGTWRKSTSNCSILSTTLDIILLTEININKLYEFRHDWMCAVGGNNLSRKRIYILFV